MKSRSPVGKNQDEMESLELSPIRNEDMHSQQQDDLEITCELIKQLLATYGTASLAFHACSTKNEETMTIEEFSSVLQNFEQFNSKEVISKVFQQLNPEGNGVISEIEWENAFKSLPHRLAIFQQNSISHNSDLHHITTHKDEDEQDDVDKAKEGMYEEKHQDILQEDELVEQQTPKKKSKQSNDEINNQDPNNLCQQNAKDTQSPEVQRECNEQSLKAEDLNQEETDKHHNSTSNPSKFLEKLSNSSGIEGLVIKCNALKVHALAQQTHNLNQTAQRNRGKQQPVSDTQVQEIFGSDLWNLESKLSNDRKKSDKKNSEYNKLLKASNGSEEKDKQQTEKQQVNVSSEQHNIDATAAAVPGGVEEAPLQNYFSCSNNNLYQMSASQAKPSRDMKTNFASYLSLIGLGQSRGAYNTPGSISITGSGANRVLSSERRGSFQTASKAAKPARNGLEGMIDQINNKKDSLLQKKKNASSNNNSNSNNTSNSQIKSSLGLQRVSLRNYDSNNNNTNPMSNQVLRQRETDGSLKQLSLQRNYTYAKNNTNYQTNKDLSDQLKKSSITFSKTNQSPQQAQAKQSFISLSKQLNNRAHSPTQAASNNSKTQLSSLYFSLRPSSNFTTGIQPLSQENRRSVLLLSAEKLASPFIPSSSVERTNDLKSFEEKLCTPQKKERKSFNYQEGEDKKQEGTPKQIYGLDEFEDYNDKEMNTQGSGYGLAH